MGILYSCCKGSGSNPHHPQGITVTHTTSHANTPPFTRRAAARYNRRHEMLMSTFNFSSESVANRVWQQEQQRRLAVSYGRVADVHKALPQLPTIGSIATSPIAVQQEGSNSSVSVGAQGSAIGEVSLLGKVQKKGVFYTTAPAPQT